MIERYDHEHPCPTATKCIEYMRKRGIDAPDGTECCVCYLRARIAERCGVEQLGSSSGS